MGTFATLRKLFVTQKDPKGFVKHMGGAGKIFESVVDIIIFLYVSSEMSVYLYLYFDTTMSDKIKESMSGDISAYPVEYGEVLDWHEVVQMLLVVANLLVFFRILMFSALLDAVHEIVKTILKALSSTTTFFLLVFVCFSLSLPVSYVIFFVLNDCINLA